MKNLLSTDDINIKNKINTVSSRWEINSQLMILILN